MDGMFTLALIGLIVSMLSLASAAIWAVSKIQSANSKLEVVLNMVIKELASIETKVTSLDIAVNRMQIEVEVIKALDKHTKKENKNADTR